MSKSRIALIALAFACTNFAMVGCSSHGETDGKFASEDINVERVEFNLIADGAEVEEVSHTVTDSLGATVQSGTLEVPGTSDSFTAFLLLPVGTGYTVTLTATGSVDGEPIPCTGGATFDVASGANSPIDVAVVCTHTVAGDSTSPDTGNVNVNATFTLNEVIEPGTSCGFTHAVVGPLAQLVGANILLQSQSVGASPVVIAWSQSGLTGTFGDPAADNTIFTCDGGSEGSITAALTDADGCTDMVSVAVQCLGDAVEPVCGNGVVETGEECDDGSEGSETCSTTCEAIDPVEPVCGDGIINQASEECDDSNTVSGDGCSATCIVEFCGDAIVNNGEECDDGVATATCSAACTIIEDTEPVCGNGIVEGDEVCDDGNDIDIDECKNDCSGSGIVSEQTCGECFNTDPGAEALGLKEYNETFCDVDPLCVASRVCVSESGCFGGENPSQLCYCGTDENGVPVDVSVCIDPGYEPTGVCAPQMLAGSGTDSPSNQTMLERQFDFLYPSGTAFGLIAFARDSAVCMESCGL